VVDGQLILGWDAARAIADGSADARSSIKRVIGALAPGSPCELPSSALGRDVVPAICRVLVERSNLEADRTSCSDHGRGAGKRAVAQRWLTLEAFRRSGFQ
jgi:hypothetical protein